MSDGNRADTPSGFVYLASPYAHADPAVMQARYEAAVRVAGSLMREGVAVYSPIAHNHPIAQAVDLPRTWDFWRRMDLPILMTASALYVLCLDGWRESIGVSAEIEFVGRMGKPIVYLPDETDGVEPE